MIIETEDIKDGFKVRCDNDGLKAIVAQHPDREFVAALLESIEQGEIDEIHKSNQKT